jgi:hypothetical protein
VAAALVVVILGLGAPFSWSTAFALQPRLARQGIDESALHAGLFDKFKWTTRALVNRDGTVGLHIPLELSGVPSDMTPRFDGLTVTIEGAGGALWNANRTPRDQVSTTGQLVALQTTVAGSFYQKVREQPVRLRGYLYMTLLGNRQVSQVAFDQHRKPVRGMGICSASGGNNAPYFLACNSAFRPQTELVSVFFEPSKRLTNAPVQALSYSPFPAELSLNPMTPHVAYSTFNEPLDAATVVSLQPLAHVRAAIAIEGLRLADYEASIK